MIIAGRIWDDVAESPGRNPGEMMINDYYDDMFG